MLVVAFKFIVFALLMIVCAMLLLLVLMQRPKQEGLGAAFGAQMTDQAFGAQTTDVLKKGTVFFGSAFMVLSFVLAVLMNAQFQNKKSQLNTASPAPAAQVTEQPATTPATEATPAPAAPVENLENLVAPTIVAPAEPAPAPAVEEPAPAVEPAPAPAVEEPAPAAEPAPAPAETPAA